MLYREISRVLGIYLYCLAGAIFLFCLISGYYMFLANPATHPQPHSFGAFVITLVACLALATVCRFWWGKKATGRLYRREGLALVVIIWFVSALIAALPFSLSGTLTNPVDAYFEAISGLTTTGASLMTDKKYDATTGKEIPIEMEWIGSPSKKYSFYGTVKPVVDPETGIVVASGFEAVGRALMLWRSFLNWLGGMGIVMLFLAILPALGVGGKVLYQAEMPGMVKDALTPRIRDTAGLLWKLYIGLTVIEVVLLMLTNHAIPFYDAVTIAFSTISTGGFTIHSSSIGYYDNATTDGVIIAFMLLGSFNFVLYVHILQRKFLRLFEPEFNVYISWLFFGIALLVILLVGTQVQLLTGVAHPDNFTFGSALRYGAFQLISLQTTTGFTTANFDVWPHAAQVLLLTVMYLGGMSGSTSGGVKMIRHTVLFRVAIQRVELMFRPQTVRTLRIGSSLVNTNLSMTVLTFFYIVIALTLVGTFLFVVDGVDVESALSLSGCMLNNIGASFRAAGPLGTFAFLSGFGKILSILWMVLGRLEYFALLIVFLPDFWRKT